MAININREIGLLEYLLDDLSFDILIDHNVECDRHCEKDCPMYAVCDLLNQAHDKLKEIIDNHRANK
jgi:hypothetical protein